ncbi:unnamed protein product [Urochloa decumbens]|uniref:RRM domain-containing protein n=1 Tax=Urochloa decumbens TaxID=240449 RepID=A0ABC8WKT8_9POAL
MPRRGRTASASTASPRPWADLPPELVREIYGRVVFAADLIRLPAVCRPWHDAVAADRPLRFPPWADLPVEALCNIRGRLDMASDSVRFHAVCWDWHAALRRNPPMCCLLPWLVAPSSAADDSAEDQRCRCVFSKATYRAPAICFRDRRVACADGTAAWVVRDKDETFLANPLTAERLPFPAGNWWLDRRHRIVYGDGDCLLLYDFDPRCRFRGYVAHPKLGDAWLSVSSDLSSSDRCCAAACHHGGYVVCVDLSTCYVLRPHREPMDKYYCTYSYTTREVRAALPEEPAGKVRLLASFAIKAERFSGEVSGGTAYLVIEDNSAGGQGRSVSPAAAEPTCSVYMYRFRDGRTALVERLPAGYGTTRGYGNNSQLRIYVGNLSPRVDNSGLRVIFIVYGKVARTRIAYDKRGRSRGLGFVTMTTQKGFDNAMAALNRQQTTA